MKPSPCRRRLRHCRQRAADPKVTVSHRISRLCTVTRHRSGGWRPRSDSPGVTAARRPGGSPIRRTGSASTLSLPSRRSPGVGVDDERDIDEHPGHQFDVGEVGHQQPIRCAHPELAVHQIWRPRRAWISDRGAHRFLSAHALPAMTAHQALHGGLGHRDALALQVRPHLHRPVQRLRLTAAVLVGFVVAGQHLSDGGVPQSPLRGRPHRPRVEGSRGDRHTVLGEHAADRSDPETVPVISDERTDLRRGQRRERGSLSRTKKDVAALSISMVCSSSALRRLNARISAAASLETPSR